VTSDGHGASVPFIADNTTLSSPDHPVLVVDLLDDRRRPFRCIPPQLWAVENNLNIADMSWADFAPGANECIHQALARIVPDAARRPWSAELPSRLVRVICAARPRYGILAPVQAGQ
jgi:hypothetical protein